MKTTFTMVVVIALCIMAAGCSPVEQREFGDEFPSLGPATRAVERIEQRLDPIAQAGERLASGVEVFASRAEGMGIPVAGLVAVIASVVGTVLGIYNERRRGTIPLRSALGQVVESVDAAFPDRSVLQKSAMASMQDRATRRFVSELKGR